jgi:hypothetical protein
VTFTNHLTLFTNKKPLKKLLEHLKKQIDIYTYSCRKLEYSPILDGIVPVRLLFLNTNILRDFMSLMNSREEFPLDISPSLSSVKEVKFENDAGIGPLKPVPRILKVVSLVQSPIKSGI